MNPFHKSIANFIQTSTSPTPGYEYDLGLISSGNYEHSHDINKTALENNSLERTAYPGYRSPQSVALINSAANSIFAGHNVEELLKFIIVNGVRIYNDERDAVLEKFNVILARYGVGKAFSSLHVPAVQIPNNNCFNRFKCILYNRLPTLDNESGVVRLVIDKSTDYINRIGAKESILKKLNDIINHKPNMSFHLYSVVPAAQDNCHILVFLNENSRSSNKISRMRATCLADHLNSGSIRTQLIFPNFKIGEIVPVIKPTEDQWRQYVEAIPTGFETEEWGAAHDLNPDPDQLYPVPVYGFSKLRDRVRLQEQVSKMQRETVKGLKATLQILKKRNQSIKEAAQTRLNKATEFETKLRRVMVSLYTAKKRGQPVEGNEVAIANKLQQLTYSLDNLFFQSRLLEVGASLRFYVMHQEDQVTKADSELSLELKSFFYEFQNAMEHLCCSVQADYGQTEIIGDKVQSQLESQSPK